MIIDPCTQSYPRPRSFPKIPKARITQNFQRSLSIAPAGEVSLGCIKFCIFQWIVCQLRSVPGWLRERKRIVLVAFVVSICYIQALDIWMAYKVQSMKLKRPLGRFLGKGADKCQRIIRNVHCRILITANILIARKFVRSLVRTIAVSAKNRPKIKCHLKWPQWEKLL